jgi:hypothetical protein
MKGLFSDDYDVRARSIEFLAGYGKEAAQALVELILRRRTDLHVLAHCGDALSEIGRPAVPAVLSGIDRVTELDQPEDVYLLQTFADLLGHFGDRRAVDGLGRQLVKLDRAIRSSGNPRLWICCDAARIRLRQVLFTLGDRGGLSDLLALLGDGRRRVPAGLVDLMAKIGNRKALLPLARLHAIEEAVSFSGAHLIREAIREIAHRERLRADDPLLKRAGPEERKLLERALPRTRGSASSGTWPSGKARSGGVVRVNGRSRELTSLKTP